VESLSGEPFEVFVERRIFKPLGMTDTFFYPPADRLPRVAAVYDAKDGQLVEPAKLLIGPTVGARHPIPAGGLYSTGGDLARLYQAMLAGGRLGDAKIVSGESLAAMTKVQTGDLACGFVPGMGFGFGWAVVRQPQDVTAMLSPGTYGHGGAFGTQGWIDPQRGYFVILLIQRVGLKNGDGSEMRRELQRIAVEAIKP
jgi:CubicO group peptidase (beta-lactamase class C family)